MATIKKAKLTKGRTLEITLEEYTEVGGNMVTNEVVKKCGYLAHNDLIQSFITLVPHMMNICEMSGNSDDFRVTGIVLTQSDENNAVMFSGSKTLSTGKVLNLNSPLQDLYGSDYLMEDELVEAVEKAVDEVQQYLDGKCAIKQTTIDFDAEDADAEISIADEKPKKRGRKKSNEVNDFVEKLQESGITVEVKAS